MKIRELMSSQVVSVSGSSSLLEVEGILVANRISGLPVVSATGALMGVISKTDLIRRYAEIVNRGTNVSKASLASMQAYEIMSPKVLTVQPDESVEKVASMMVESRVHRVFVTDASDEIVGVASSLDLLRAIAPENP